MVSLSTLINQQAYFSVSQQWGMRPWLFSTNGVIMVRLCTGVFLFSIWRCGYYPRGQGLAGFAWPSYSLLADAISTPSACKKSITVKAMFHLFQQTVYLKLFVESSQFKKYIFHLNIIYFNLKMCIHSFIPSLLLSSI